MSIGTYIYCPICDKMEKVRIVEHTVHKVIDSVPIDYSEIYYQCPVSGEYFETNDFKNRNALRAKSAYNYNKHAQAFGAMSV